MTLSVFLITVDRSEVYLIHTMAHWSNLPNYYYNETYWNHNEHTSWNAIVSTIQMQQICGGKYMSEMAVKAVNRTKEVVVVETKAEQVKGECQV